MDKENAKQQIKELVENFEKNRAYYQRTDEAARIEEKSRKLMLRLTIWYIRFMG